MPAAMSKSGGGGKYGVATTRLTKTEIIMQDIDTGDRFAFPLVSKPAKFPAMPNLSTMILKGQAALVANPSREDKIARTPVVFSGTFAYGMNAKGDILYNLSPANDSHLCIFSGFARPNNDPKAVPVWEARHSTFDPSRVQKEFSATFSTADSDETPGLEVRWSYWRYKFSPTVNQDGEDIMGVETLNAKSGSALKAQYELLRLAGIIGRDPDTKEMMVLRDIPGALENYLPAVETILRDKLSSMTFILAFETYEGADGKSRVRINSLSKQPGAVDKTAVKTRKANNQMSNEDIQDEKPVPTPPRKRKASQTMTPLTKAKGTVAAHKSKKATAKPKAPRRPARPLGSTRTKTSPFDGSVISIDGW